MTDGHRDEAEREACGCQRPPSTETYCTQWDHWHVHPVPTFICRGSSPPNIEARQAIADQLMRDYESEYTVTESVSAWYPQAERILQAITDAGYRVTAR